MPRLPGSGMLPTPEVPTLRKRSLCCSIAWAACSALSAVTQNYAPDLQLSLEHLRCDVTWKHPYLPCAVRVREPMLALQVPALRVRSSHRRSSQRESAVLEDATAVVNMEAPRPPPQSGRKKVKVQRGSTARAAAAASRVGAPPPPPPPLPGVLTKVGVSARMAERELGAHLGCRLWRHLNGRLRCTRAARARHV